MLASYNGHKEVVEFLLSKGADVNSQDDSGKKPIDYANENGQTETKAILEKAMNK